MANRTVRDAHTIHGKNPQNLVEKIIRNRIYECRYWKEDCFGLNAELFVDKACELTNIGGVIGGIMNPSPFLCLIQKLLQIQPDKDIVIEFIKRSEFKYARALGALYLRLTGESVEIYKYLETLYNDYSKLRRQEESGDFTIVHMDEFIDELLREDRVCSLVLPRLQKRQILEDQNLLEPRISILDKDLQEMMLQAVEAEEEEEERRRIEAETQQREAHEQELAREKEERERKTDTSSKRQREQRDSGRRRSRSRSREPARRRSRSPRRDHHTSKRRDRSRERRDARRGSSGEAEDRGGRNHRDEKSNREPEKRRRDHDRHKDRH